MIKHGKILYHKVWWANISEVYTGPALELDCYTGPVPAASDGPVRSEFIIDSAGDGQVRFDPVRSGRFGSTYDRWRSGPVRSGVIILYIDQWWSGLSSGKTVQQTVSDGPVQSDPVRSGPVLLYFSPAPVRRKSCSGADAWNMKNYIRYYYNRRNELWYPSFYRNYEALGRCDCTFEIHHDILTKMDTDQEFIYICIHIPIFCWILPR